MSIYQEIILDHYRAPHNQGKLDNPTATAAVFNPLCGDKLNFDVVTENGLVKEIAFNGQGCAISQASASMLTDYAKGKNIEELKKLDRDFMIDMIGIELSPNRIKCALLSLEALSQVISNQSK